MHQPSSIKLDARGLHIGLAVSRYHAEITESMREAAIDAFMAAGGSRTDLRVVPVAGTFELTAVCHALATLTTDESEPELDALVALGCVIAGKTTHDQYICQAVTQGLVAVIVKTGVPIAFGVLTCQSLEQARARSVDAERLGGMNKGAEAMRAAIETARTVRALKSGKGVLR